jgi:murein L,D-transpeptidase YafK
MDSIALLRFAFVAGIGLLATGCVENGSLPSAGRGWVAISSETQGLMASKNMTRRDPVLLRAYKKESELEVWKKDTSGTYQLLKTYPMCRWSGQLGPKVREGDRQVPEGFYTITPAAMNPNSSYYLSFNVGYPNKYDRAFGRTGGNIMVHGACTSAGCLSMTDEQIADLYALLREAFAGGQKEVQLQSFPFRMTAKNLAKFRLDANMPFWKNLKQGSDHVDVTKVEPRVAVCARKYVFNETSKGGSFDATAACPPMEMDASLKQAVTQKQHADEIQVAELIQRGEKAVRRIYQDGDQNPSFKAKQMAYSGGVPVSRIDALAEGAVEIPVEDTKIAKAETPAKAAASSGAEMQLASAPAKPAVATPAVAAAPVPAAAQAFAPAETASVPVETKSTGFFGRFTGLLGASSDSAGAASPQAALVIEVNVPLPPRRQASNSGKQAAASIPEQFVGLAQAQN